MTITFFPTTNRRKIIYKPKGKAIELYLNNQFDTYLGFRKNMAFKVEKQVKIELLADVVT